MSVFLYITLETEREVFSLIILLFARAHQQLCWQDKRKLPTRLHTAHIYGEYDEDDDTRGFHVFRDGDGHRNRCTENYAIDRE